MRKDTGKNSQRNPAVSAFTESVRKDPRLVIFLAAMIAGSVYSALLPPILLGRMVDALVSREMLNGGQITLYIVLLIVAGVFSAGKNALISIFGQRVTHQLRSDMASKLNRLPADYFTRHESGALTSLFVNDVDTIQTLFDDGIISMITDLCTLAGILVVVFRFSKGLGLLLVIALPVLFLFTRHCQKRMRKAQLDYRQTVADLSDQIPQTIKNRRTIRVYQASTYMEKLYDATIRRSFDAMEQSNFYDSIYSPVIITTSSIVIAIMMTLAAMGGRWTAFFGMGAGTAVTAIAYVNNVFGPLADIGMEIQNIQAAAAGIARIGTFMAHAEEKHGTGASEENAPAAVDLEHVSFSYDPKEPLIHDFSLRVNTGEMVTLVGRTGSGKSTIFKLVLGLYAPDAGEVRVLGQRPQDITEEERRHVFGYVEQQFHPVEGTLKDQVSINDPHVDEDQVRRALKTVGLLDVLEHLPAGLDTPYSPGVLSQGQFQLLSIARAIVCDPKVLLLDEITANLDSNTEKKVMDAIFHACSGRTVLSISHRLYEHTGGRMVFIGKDAEKK